MVATSAATSVSSAAMDQSSEMQSKIRFQAQEMTDYYKEIAAWEKEAKNRDEKIRSAKKQGIYKAPIRKTRASKYSSNSSSSTNNCSRSGSNYGTTLNPLLKDQNVHVLNTQTAIDQSKVVQVQSQSQRLESQCEEKNPNKNVNELDYSIQEMEEKEQETEKEK